MNLFINSRNSYIAKIEWINQRGTPDSESFLVRNRDGREHYVLDLTKKETWTGQIASLNLRFYSFDDHEGERSPQGLRTELKMDPVQLSETANYLPPPEAWSKEDNSWSLSLDTLLPGAEYRWVGDLPEINVETFEGDRLPLLAVSGIQDSGRFTLPLDALRVNFRVKEAPAESRLELVSLNSPQLPEAGKIARPIKTSPSKKTFPSTQVRWFGKQPELVIDGKSQAARFFHLSGSFVVTPSLEAPMVIDLAKNGVNLFAISNEYFNDRTWPEEDRFDFSEFDEAMRTLLAANPEARTILLPSLNMPQWWQKKYPGDLVTSFGPDGIQTAPTMQSPASLQWRADGRKYLEALIQHVGQSEYASAVIGMFPCGLQTIEWAYPPTEVHKDADLTDYSPASVASLQQYVRNKYVSVEELRRVYHDPAATFEGIAMPSPTSLQEAELGRFRDPKIAQAAIDYWECRAEITAETLLGFCKVVKDATAGRLLVGSYFGYWLNYWPQQYMARSGQGMLDKLTSSPFVDVVCAPADYLFRLGDSPASTTTPADSLRLNRKLWIQEDDMRGYLAKKSYVGADTTYYHGKTDTVADALSLLRKQYALNRAQGHAFWWFDLDRGWFTNFKLNQALLGRWMQAERKMQADANGLAVPTEVAFVLDGRSSFVDKMSGGVGQIELRAQIKTFNQLAAPRDLIQLRDFETAAFLPYKLYVFLNCFIVEPALREKIHRKLSENHAMAVWVHSAGFFDGSAGETPVEENIFKTTGFQVEANFNEGAIATDIVQPGGQAIKWEFPGTTSPRFFIKETDVTIWSQTDGEITAAFKKMPGWQSAYFSSQYLPAEALNFLYGKAGVTLYSSDPDYFYLGDGFFASNVVSSGEKHFRFPISVEVSDYESGKLLAHDIQDFSFMGTAGETYLFAVTTAKKQ